MKHGYVQRTAEWQFSTFHRFVRAGVYPIDWGIGDASAGRDFGEP